MSNKKNEKCALKWCTAQPHLFKNVFQYQMAKFSNPKSQLLLHQPYVWYIYSPYSNSPIFCFVLFFNNVHTVSGALFIWTFFPRLCLARLLPWASWSLCHAAPPSRLCAGWLPCLEPVSSPFFLLKSCVSKHILSGSFLFDKMFLGILWCAYSPLLCELCVLFYITFITSCPVLNVEFMDFFPHLPFRTLHFLNTGAV